MMKTPMKQKIFFLISILIVLINCQKVQAQNAIKAIKSENSINDLLINRTPLEIAEALKPKNSTIVHDVIKTDIWGFKNAIIAFYETKFVDSVSTTQKYERQYVEAFIYFQQKESWQKVLIYKFEDDNVFTEIRSVFFANADKDAAKELIILSSCTHRLQYLYEGVEYSTSFYDDIKSSKLQKELIYLDKISEKLDGGFEGYLDDNPNSKARFTTAKQVKLELKILGF